MPTHLAYNQSEVTCSHFLWSLTTENQATINRFKKTHFTKGPTAYTKLLSNGMVKRNNYHRNIKMKFGIISALKWCFILSNIYIRLWQFPSTSSPGRFSLALGAGRPQSQGKAPWGRGWVPLRYTVLKSLKKWPARKAEHVSARGRRNEAPRRTREKTSGTQGRWYCS